MYVEYNATEVFTDWNTSKVEVRSDGALQINGNGGRLQTMNSFDTTGHHHIHLEFHLTPSDDGGDLGDGEYARLQYSIDDSRTWLELKDYGQEDMADTDEDIELPDEVNDNIGVRIRFENTGDDHEGDRF